MTEVTRAQRIRELTRGLRAARRRIYARRLAAGLGSGIRIAVVLLLAWSMCLILYGLARLPGHLSHERFPWVVALVCAFAGAAIGLLRAALRPPVDTEAAERLDWSAANHNRIASALDFLRSEDDTPMTAAAVEDGFVSLQKITKPVAVEPVSWIGARDVRRVLFAAFCCAIALSLPWLSQLWRGRPVVVAKSPPTAFELVAPPTSVPAAQIPPKPPVPQIAPSSASTGSRTTASAASSELGDAQASVTSGGAGSGSGVGKAGNSAQSPEKTAVNRNAAAPPETKSREGKPSKGSGAAGAVEGSATGSVGAGGKSAGGFSLASEKESRTRDMTELDADMDTGGESAEADENNENKHRGGAQPLRQDRLQAPTRELGIGALKGSPGTGRGGPTPMKKARGAGALFLGVPMPDFVPGKLLAGTSKIVRENIKPRRSDEKSPPAADVAPRAADESVLERYDVSPADGNAVLRYFNELHKDDADIAPPTTSTSPNAEEGAKPS